MEFAYPKRSLYQGYLIETDMVTLLIFKEGVMPKGFEYRNKKSETPFEVFLRYSNEKEKSAQALGRILARVLKNDAVFLDIGSGNGEYLALALKGIKKANIKFVLLEPSGDLIERLRLAIRRFPLGLTTEITQTHFEHFVSKEYFDVILVSHAPLARDRLWRLPKIYKSMLQMLKRGGSLIVVSRKRDDIYEFRAKFKSMLLGKIYRPLTIDDAGEVFKTLAKQISLRIETTQARAVLKLPYPENKKDTITIIEFLLNEKWGKILGKTREAIFRHIDRKKSTLRQIEGLAILKKIKQALND